MSKREPINNQNFFGMLAGWLQSLPTDIKILIEMIRDDELDLNARSVAVGVVIYILAPIDLIPEKIPILGYIDDVIILHIGLMVILEMDSVRAQYYREKYSDTFVVLDQQIELLRTTLGALYTWLKALVDKLQNRRYHGKTADEVTASEQIQDEMFDEAMEYAANVNVDRNTIEEALLSTPPDRIVALLSSGLEDEQKRRIEAEKDQETTKERLITSIDGFRKLLGRGS